MTALGWQRIRHGSAWHIRHATTGEVRGPFPDWRTADGRAAGLNRRSALSAQRRELAAFIASIRSGEVGAIAVLADWQEECGRCECAEKLRAIHAKFEAVRRRGARPRDRIALNDRLAAAIARACTHALRAVDDWWIRRRQNKDILAQRAAEAVHAVLVSPVQARVQ